MSDTLISLEVGRGQGVERETKIEVREIAETAVELRFQLLLQLAKRVEGSVALVERRRVHTGWQHDVRAEPFEDRPALRPRTKEAFALITNTVSAKCDAPRRLPAATKNV